MAAGKPNEWRGPERDCARCGERFVPKHPNGRFCSAYCRTRMQRNSRVSPQRRAVIHERDKWICYLCELPVIRTTKPFNPLMAVIDHVVPLAEGGHRTAAENLRTAHFACNSQKSIYPAEEFKSRRAARKTSR